MKRKIAWLIVSCLMALSLVLASCAPAVTEEEEEVVPPTVEEEEVVVEEEVAPGAEEPIYGGTLNIAWARPDLLARWDPTAGSHETLAIIYEHLLYHDWYKSMKEWGSEMAYGPASVRTGWLAESWEVVDPYTFSFRLREGVRWHNVPPANGRELVAEDVKFSCEWYASSPRAPVSMDWASIESITVPDKYTIVFHFSTPQTSESLGLFHGSGGGMMTFCPDPVKEYGDLAYQDWELACGTGPYMVVDYVAGSSATYDRNPDYWDFDQNDPENRLPYIDRLNLLIIVDKATQLSALRTGKVDFITGIAWDQVEMLEETSPELNKQGLLGMPGLFSMHTKKEPYTDVRVRRAMNMAIDYPGIVEGYYKGNAEVAYTTWPFHRSLGDEALKYDELTQIIKDQFEYNPEMAKELLAEAGYPDGFQTDVVCLALHADMLAIVKEYLADVGVDLEIKVTESGAFSSLKYGSTFEQCLSPTIGGVSWQGGPRQDLTIWYTPCIYDYGDYDNPDYMARLEAAKSTEDETERKKLYKELGIFVLEEAIYVLLPAPYTYTYWQPWVKGYSGQYGMMYCDMNMYKYWWLDLDQKEKITGGR